MAINQTKLGLSASGSEHAAGGAAEVQRQQRAAAGDDFLLDSKSLALCWRFLLQVLATSLCFMCHLIRLECCQGLVNSATMPKKRCMSFTQVRNALDSVPGVCNKLKVAHASSLQPASSALCCPLNLLCVTAK